MSESTPWVVLQHVAHEGPGAIATSLAAAGLEHRVVRIDQGEPVPNPEDAATMSGLVVLGGPMSVHDPMPWLSDERALMKAAVQSGITVLGICLGAQQLALALGGQVTTGPEPEVGVGEVHLTNNCRHDPVFGPAATPLPCFHWHSDTFTLPDDAIPLATSEQYEQQAFRVGERAYGLQFHVEVTAALAAHWGPHLPPGVFVRTPDVAHISRSGAGVLERLVSLAL